MHTPRFSGQLSSAGDFVFVRICSRPWRTSCENVGTNFPFLSGFRQRPHTFAKTRTAQSNFFMLRGGTLPDAAAQTSQNKFQPLSGEL
jgi:hypothetical protein